ncbi:MAG: histidine phosphatase family protein [Sphingobium sp.]
MLCAGATASGRRGSFPASDESLDARGLRDATAFRLPPRFAGNVLCSPWRAAHETAEATGLAAQSEPALAELAPGRWAGRSFEEIEATEPGALASWLADPLRGTPDGETMADARLRIGGWLDGIADRAEAVCAISHPMAIRAALAHALGFPLATTLAIDIAPLSRTQLSFNRKWRLQAIAPL